MNKIIVYNPNKIKDNNIPAYLNVELKKAYTNEKLSYITFIFDDLSKKLKDQNSFVTKYKEFMKEWLSDRRRENMAAFVASTEPTSENEGLDEACIFWSTGRAGRGLATAEGGQLPIRKHEQWQPAVAVGLHGYFAKDYKWGGRTLFGRERSIVLKFKMEHIKISNSLSGIAIQCMCETQTFLFYTEHTDRITMTITLNFNL